MKKVSGSSSKQLRCAVIGSGCAGIAAAQALRARGCDVTIYEKEAVAGGLLNIIPSERIDKSKILGLISGIKIVLNADIDLKNLAEFARDFDYVFVATGTQNPKKLPFNDPRIIHAVEFLKSDIKPLNSAVIGGGNAAIDCAVASIERGGQATIYYRRLRENMPAHATEIERAENIGVKFVFSANVTTPDAFIEHDLIIAAIGADPETIAPTPRVFLIGDAATGASNIAHAMLDAKKTVAEIFDRL